MTGRAISHYKVCGCTLGGTTVVFRFAAILNCGQLLKERICSHRSKFFPLRVDPISEYLRRFRSGKQPGKVTKVVSFCENRDIQNIDRQTDRQTQTHT